MEESAPNIIPEAATPIPEIDWLLLDLIHFVNGTEMNVSITLLMDGFLVSGDLVGGDRYFEKYIKSLFGSRETSPGFDELFDHYEKQQQSYKPENSDPKSRVEYFHLFDAKFFQPNGRGIPANGGIEFRGKLRDVSGFYLGKLCDPADEYVDLNPEETTPTAGNAS